MSPLKQFSFAFEYDCQHSDVILPIGYPFSDNHINLTIKDAIEANNKIKFLNITYCEGKYFTNGNKELSRIELYILKLNNQFRDNKFKLTDEEIISSDGNQIMCFKGVGTFLKNNLWEKHL
jgi:hypothetical protein